MNGEREVVITSKDASPVMRPLLAKLGIAIDDEGKPEGWPVQESGLFNMPPRPMFRVKQ